MIDAFVTSYRVFNDDLSGCCNEPVGCGGIRVSPDVFMCASESENRLRFLP